jgi:hypothetical protein
MRDLETGDGFCLTNNSKDGLNREFSYPSILADAGRGAARRLHLFPPRHQIRPPFATGFVMRKRGRHIQLEP